MKINPIVVALWGCLVFAGMGVQSAGAGSLSDVRKILYLGNSITLHPPYEAIGWSNNWGMAASAESKDYVHVVAAAVAERTGVTPEIRVRNIADFERNYATFDVENQFVNEFAFKPDLFVLAIGENVSLADATQFKSGVLRIINGVLAQNSDAIIVVRSCFWADAAKDLALSQAAQQAGAIFVNIGALGALESNLARSEPTFADSAYNTFNTHPGDRGMAAIASAIVQAVEAEDVSAELAADDAFTTGDLPLSLRDSAGLAFWVDANRNVATNESGTVTAWYDVREASGGTTYPRANKVGSELAPTLVTGGSDVAGNKLVDFDFFPSGKWLQWQDSAGSLHQIGGIRTVFMAISCTNGTGFLLGDATGNPGGNYCFHVGNSGSNGLETIWYQNSGGGDDFPVRYGFTRVNGELIDGMHSLVPHVGTVMSVQTAWGALASNFCNDRNLRNGAWGVTPDRLGGGRIGEVLIYTSELSDVQRMQVEDYLMRKWLRRPLASTSVASGDTLSMTTTNALDLAKVSGAGTLDIVGAGNIALPDLGDLALPPIHLDAGASAGGTNCKKIGQPFVLAGGANYDATTGVCARTGLADLTVAAKSGSGVLTVSSLDEGVSSIAVNAGTLRLSPALPGAWETLTNSLENGSFETQDGVTTPNGNGLIYLENTSYCGWTYTFGAGGNCGLAVYGSAFCNKQPPDGSWVMFLVNDCTVAKSFTAPVEGRYEISFYTATGANASWPYHLYQVLVDGNVVGSIRTSETEFQHVLCRTPALTAGTHTLTFNGILEANRVSLVDNIQITPCIEADEFEVPNGGFELPTVLTMPSSGSRPYAVFQNNPSGASWIFTSDCYSGTTEGYSTWRCKGMEEGGHAAILNNSYTTVVDQTNYVNTISSTYGVMSLPLTFPTAGVYRITFKAACRTARYDGLWNRWDDGSALNGITFALSLGGVEAARATHPSLMGDFVTYEYTLPVVADGALTQTLAFQIMNTDWFATLLIDDVRIFKMPPIKNPGFEDVSEGGLAWTLDRGSVECGITTPGEYSWTVTCPEGARCLIMANNGSATQNITFDSDGTYELSFLAARSYGGAPGHEFAVTFDGMQVGSVRTESTTFQRYRFRLPYVKAGQSHSLVLQGLIPGGTWYASLIDSVILRKIVPEPTPLSSAMFANATLAVAEGASLELDYPGTLELDTFKYAGIQHSGTFNASNTSYIRGTGSLVVRPKGSLLFLR